MQHQVKGYQGGAEVAEARQPWTKIYSSDLCRRNASTSPFPEASAYSKLQVLTLRSTFPSKVDRTSVSNPRLLNPHCQGLYFGRKYYHDLLATNVLVVNKHFLPSSSLFVDARRPVEGHFYFAEADYLALDRVS